MGRVNFATKIQEDEYGFTEIVFLGDPSRVHGFDKEPPKKWDEVYKTYLSWIIRYTEHGRGFDNPHTCFSATWDECSPLNDLLETLKSGCYLEQDITTVRALGDNTWWDIIPDGEHIRFVVYPIRLGSAYTFSLDKEQVDALIDTLEKYLAYALEHSQGI